MNGDEKGGIRRKFEIRIDYLTKLVLILSGESFTAAGVTMDGGFAEYIIYHYAKVSKFKNLTDEEATLLEPASCAVHGLERLNPKVCVSCLFDPLRVCRVLMFRLSSCSVL